jgi:DHA1 family inner membrane transport protein
MQARVLNSASGAPTLAIAVNASAYQLAAAFAGWFGGRVIDDMGLRAIYIVAAGVTVLSILVSCVAWYRDHVAAAAQSTSDHSSMAT